MSEVEERIMEGSSTPFDEGLEEDFKPSRCPYCRLDLDLHDGSGFCPAGTEEFGGRR